MKILKMTSKMLYIERKGVTQIFVSRMQSYTEFMKKAKRGCPQGEE